MPAATAPASAAARLERLPFSGYHKRIFFIIAIVAAVFGFGGIAAGAAEIAKILFYIFVVIFLVTLLLGVVRR